MLKRTSVLGTDFRATTTTDITLMGTIIRTALSPTISHTIAATTIGLIIGTVATVTTANINNIIIVITTTIKLR
jgi:hypothetical protein